MLGRRSQRSLFSLTQHQHRQMASQSRSLRPAQWKTAAPEPLLGTLTFAAQSKLPQLPVPELKDTLNRLKESLKPIAWSDAEYASVVKKIDAFEREKGQELHQRLLQKAATRQHWLEEWWDDAGYLGYRDSVVVNVSYYYGFDQSPSHLSNAPATRAAGIARAAMIFRQKLKQGLIKPESTKEGPLCMDTYRWMFDCCRVPGEGLDWSVSYAKNGELGDSGHIIVIRKNRVYKVDVTHNGRILSTSEIEKQIQHIYENTLQEYPGVGVLSASDRDIWAKDYAELEKSSVNSKILEAIHSSAFVISLESSQPRDPIHHSRALWHGDVIGGIPVGLRNRWVDKPVQFVVFDNGYAGLMGEHSVMDGTPTARMCDEVLDILYDPAFDHGSSSGPEKTPTPLDWEVTEATTQAIAKADHAAAELIHSQELGFHITSYGKAAIKAFGVSPDSWAQMIIQLAYRRLLGTNKRNGGTYEAASTRKFFKGRTEAIRVVTSEADEWVRSMDDPAATAETRKKLFDSATRKHVSLAKAGGQGQGVDRHLFGLRKVLKESEGLPELYDDPVFKRSSYWVLSTSAIFSKHFPVYGWGEVVPDGFGVAYVTGYDDRLQYTITSRKEMPNARFVKEVGKAAQDLYALHSSVPPVKAKL
ncbi:acyltransferase ChoActase/COT/CPT [Gymnopilus junonius]|uniref:Acyltransferase ChoActase/COT/CPT n=1 Tax=Gymnopilus junonius TaxID=109634 RepID=A0A9P5NU50_GYMJU|nr:acyltransferase ChoActase/COT/CPT [Gymnopilus junonius]